MTADIDIKSFLSSPHCKSLARATADTYRHAINSLTSFISGRAGNRPEPSITADLLNDYTQHMAGLGKSGKTIQQYITIIKIAMRSIGHPIEYTYRIPNAEKKAHKLKSMNRWFTEDEIRQCLGYRWPEFHIRNHLIVRLMIETGARVREIANVRFKDVAMTKKTVWLTDSKTEPRPVFYSDDTKRSFEKLLRATNVIIFDHQARKVFPSPQHIKKIITDMLVDIGIKDSKDGRGPHTFRHYSATYLHYVGGMSLADIGRLFGDKPEMIRDRYLHPTPEMMQAKMEKAMNW
ncbi:MAG: tyrosine-type recombinase/integrase [Desulfobacterales bacterium]|jgi:integrase|nr:tyrosine-type recombinase/integrase [Desulfobacterales bacterium]